MVIGIIGAMAQETKLLIENMRNVEKVKVDALEFVVGNINSKQVVLVESGIGKVNSAIATTLLITQFKVDYVINTGSAGAIDHSLHIGDIVVSNQVAYHDADATAFGYKMGQIPQMPLYYLANTKLVETAINSIDSLGMTSIVGEIVSSDSFIASSEKINTIRYHFPLAKCSEMEGASIAQVCYVFSVPFVVVRAISDSANEKASVSFDEFIVTAGENSAKMVLKMLETL